MCIKLLVIVKTSHAIMNVLLIYTLLPHAECTIMTVVITFLFIVIYSYSINRQNVNYLHISCF